MARIAGTGIKEASEKSKKVAQVYYGGIEAENRRRTQSFLKELGEKNPLSGGSGGTITVPGTVPVKQVSAEGDETFEKSDFFSMTTDPRNKVKIASADLGSLDVGDSFTKQADKNLASAGDSSGTFDESDYQGYTKALGIKNYRGLPPTMQRMLRENYRDDVRDGRYKEGQLINKAPVKEKPSFIDQTKNFAGSIFNAITGTQEAAASQIPGGIPNQTQFTSSNLDAAKASTGDTSFASYRMAGQTPTTTTPQTLASKQESKTYEQNRLKPGEKFADRGQREAINASGFQQANVQGSAFNTGKDESKRPKTVPKTVTVDGQTVAARQTVASLPSDYKQTEAREFAKAAAFQQAKKNPNVTTSIDSKGQVTVKPVQKTRADAGASANTAEGNQARVKQNAVARAQAAAINRKISGKSISQVKAANRESMRAAAAERQATFKKTGKSTAAARKAAAKASMKAKAKARHASFKKKRAAAKAAKAKAKARKKAFSKGGARNKRRRRSRGRRRCDIFLKYNISPLVNMNLIRDDLAEVAYFVKEIQE